MSNSPVIYSESDDIDSLYHLLLSVYPADDIHLLYKVVAFLIHKLMYHPRYSHHYNKHTIVMSCLYQFYKAYPHGRVIVHSYSTYVSEEIHRLRGIEYEKKKGAEQRTSAICRLCVIS